MSEHKAKKKELASAQHRPVNALVHVTTQRPAVRTMSLDPEAETQTSDTKEFLSPSVFLSYAD